MMTSEHDGLDRQVHDAYESIELGQDAQNRMLSQLLAAQARRERAAEETEPEAVDAVSDTTTEDSDGRVLRMRPRRYRWVALPIAAALLVAAVVMRVNSTMQEDMQPQMNVAPASSAKSSDEYDQTVAKGEAAADEAPVVGETLVMETETYESAEESNADVAMQDSAVTYAEVVRMAELYPQIACGDLTLEIARVEGSPSEVDASDVGELVGQATASSPEGEESVPCEVYRLASDPDAYAVCYEGEQTYWLCA